ncbi:MULTISPECIES: hypothetical protein [Aminobacter]|jgi:hypothetical protein|uniref:Uncharacterized protein n=1 Tax=Aminobacter aminovorans TaxID=83263 RepID=A0ABR6H413_AMIAI|nr:MULTISPECIES: hypothetical protein [Aminobacter]MBB3705257.1 hypothetical protein [Aminobacter aminovorans]
MNNEFMQTRAYASLLILADPPFADIRAKIATGAGRPGITRIRVSVIAASSTPPKSLPRSAWSWRRPGSQISGVRVQYVHDLRGKAACLLIAGLCSTCSCRGNKNRGQVEAGPRDARPEFASKSVLV